MQARKVTHWHGFTLQSWQAFKAGACLDSFVKPGVSPWTVSDNDGMMYFHSVEKAERNLFFGDDVMHEQVEHECKNQAYASAALQACMNAQETIFCVGFDLTGVDYYDDLSCEGMEDAADCARVQDINLSNVVEAFSKPFSKYWHAFMVAGFDRYTYFNKEELPHELTMVCQAINRSGVDVCAIDILQETEETSESI